MPRATTSASTPRRSQRARAQSLIADMAIGLLSFFVLLCVGLITPPLWNAIVASTAPRSDAFVHPAKGATAPLDPAGAAPAHRGAGP
jgi:hypothetical protein